MSNEKQIIATKGIKLPNAKKIVFDKESLERFKKYYDDAEKGKLESFTFDGNEYVTLYAKYLIQFIEPKLK